MIGTMKTTSVYSPGHRRRARHPDLVLGFDDEEWWSREAQPHRHAWSDGTPVRLGEQTVPAKDPAGKAMACDGLSVPTKAEECSGRPNPMRRTSTLNLFGWG